MRIGYDAKRVFSNWTGLGNYARTILTNLDHYFPDEEYVLYAPKARKEAELKAFHHPPYQVIEPNTRFRSWWRRYGIGYRLQADGIDLYHGLSNELPAGISKRGTPSVVTIHDLIFKHYPDTYGLIDREIYDRKFRAACRNADRIIAISASTKADIIRFYDIPPERIQVIYQACDPLFYRKPYEDIEVMTVLESYGIPDEYFLYVGSVIPRKNLLSLVKALQILPEPDRLPLVVVGRGGRYMRQIKQYVKDNGLEHWVNWQPNVLSTRDLKAIYEKATAFIYPSVSEGFGIPVVEALLSKTPVITSNLSSLPEAAGPDSMLINPEDEEEMAEALSVVKKDEHLREGMIEQGYAYAKSNFSPRGTTEQVMELYQQIIGK